MSEIVIAAEVKVFSGKADEKYDFIKSTMKFVKKKPAIDKLYKNYTFISQINVI